MRTRQQVARYLQEMISRQMTRARRANDEFLGVASVTAFCCVICNCGKHKRNLDGKNGSSFAVPRAFRNAGAYLASIALTTLAATTRIYAAWATMRDALAAIRNQILTVYSCTTCGITPCVRERKASAMVNPREYSFGQRLL